MEEKKNLAVSKDIIFIYIIFAVGIAGHFSSSYSGLMLKMTPYVLLATGLYVIIKSQFYKYRKFIIWFTASYFVTFVLEIIGVRTGIVFGDYSYGNVLGFKLFDVPLIIGFNWMLVILGAISISRRFSGNVILISVISGLSAVVFDLILEPVAVKLGYWSWDSGVIPVQNYISWFIISFVITLGFMKMNIKVFSKIFIHYFIAMTLFFLILNFL